MSEAERLTMLAVKTAFWTILVATIVGTGVTIGILLSGGF